MIYAIFIVAAAVANAVSQILLRLAMRSLRDNRTSDHVHGNYCIKFVSILCSFHLVAGFILFSTSLFLYMIVLRDVDVVVAYPAMGLTHVFVMVLSSLFLREKIDAWKIAGTGMITIGLAMLAIGAG